MNDFSSFRTDHILFGLDCMISFAEWADGRPYDVDLDAGAMTIGGEVAPISIVGSWAGPPTSSWLWGWANPGWKDLPEDALAPSRALQNLGELVGVEEFTSPEIPMQDDTFGFEVAAIACGLTSAAGALQHQHSGGSAFFVFPTLPSGTSDLGSRHLRVIMEGIQAYDVPHRPAIGSYLGKVGYTLTESGPQTTADRHDGQLTISFDDGGRLVDINGSIGPTNNASAQPEASPPTEESGGGFFSKFRKK